MKTQLRNAMYGLDLIQESEAFFIIKVKEVSSKLTFSDLVGEEYKIALEKAKEILRFSLGYDFLKINSSEKLKNKKESYSKIYLDSINTELFKFHFGEEFKNELVELIKKENC